MIVTVSVWPAKMWGELKFHETSWRLLNASASRHVVNTWRLPLGVFGEDSCTYHRHIIYILIPTWMTVVMSDLQLRLFLTTEWLLQDCVNSHLWRFYHMWTVIWCYTSKSPLHLDTSFHCHQRRLQLIFTKTCVMDPGLLSPLLLSLIHQQQTFFYFRTPSGSTLSFPRENFAMSLTMQNSRPDWITVLCGLCLNCCIVLWSDSPVLSCLCSIVCFSLEMPVLVPGRLQYWHLSLWLVGIGMKSWVEEDLGRL